MAKYGRAYAFFCSKASKNEIEKALPSIREALHLHPLMELSLHDRPEAVKAGRELKDIAKKAVSQGCSYAFELACPGAADDVAAEQMVTILNEAFRRDPLKKDERFMGAVVYKEGKGYSFRIG